VARCELGKQDKGGGQQAGGGVRRLRGRWDTMQSVVEEEPQGWQGT